MKIKVAKKHIEEAIPRNSHHCMIAEAIREEVHGATAIQVDLQSIRWSDREAGVRYFFFTPPAGQEALLKFDKGEEVKPFELELKKAVIRPVGLTSDMRPIPTQAQQARRKKVAPGNRMVRRISINREFGIRRFKDVELELDQVKER